MYVSLLLSGFVSRGNGPLRNQFYYLWLFVLFLFVGFRYRVGCDWGGYLVIFENSRIYETSSTTEQAFWLLNSLLHYLQLDYPYINVVSSGIFSLGLHQIAKRQPDRLSILILSFPILIINLAMSGIRQAIALGILCFAFNAFIDMSLLRCVLFTLIASMFHTSAGAFLMLTPFVRGRFSRQRIILGGSSRCRAFIIY
ncbi:EpsG family protein [Methylocystis sp. IM4]|uniref:EpsG family protein n=1 Tax=Methylocystis sp. IM4 TaxID=3136560 RepID=UPI003119352E